MIKKVYLAWQDAETRSWFPVGQLTYNDKVYRFMYTKGAKVSNNFIPFGQMIDLEYVYESDKLFPLFANRLISKTRPEYKNFLYWLNMSENEDDPLALLALSGGTRETDSLEVFSCPDKSSNGKYHMHFFSHGIRYLPEHAVQLINNLKPKDKLFLMHDLQNPYDKFALAIRTSEKPTIIGYCPRYFTEDFLFLLNQCGGSNVHLEVERVNKDAPTQLRLLCSLSAPWADAFKPCSSELYSAIAQEVQPLISVTL